MSSLEARLARDDRRRHALGLLRVLALVLLVLAPHAPEGAVADAYEVCATPALDDAGRDAPAPTSAQARAAPLPLSCPQPVLLPVALSFAPAHLAERPSVHLPPARPPWRRGAPIRSPSPDDDP